MKTLKLPTIQTTAELARQIAQTLNGGEILALSGPLGSGKTTFVQYLARELDAREQIKSPSFIVLQTFNIKSKFKRQKAKVQGKSKKLILCHVDAYRIKDKQELDALGLYDYLSRPDVITVIEWAEKIKKALPPKTIWLKFKYAKDGRSVLLHAP